MADAFVRVPPDDTGKKIATQECARGADTVERQEVVLADPATAAAMAAVANATPGASTYGVVTRSAPAGAIQAGRATVNSPTAAALPTVACRTVRLRALLGNDSDNPIEIGPAGFAAGGGFPLWPGDMVPDAIEVANLNLIHALCAVAGQGLAYFAEV